jgi:hypothetical protein
MFIEITKNNGEVITVNTDYIIDLEDYQCSSGEFTIITVNVGRKDPTYWVSLSEGNRIRSLLLGK